MLLPLLDALELMHSKQCYHRDIAPDNILLLDDDEEPAPGQPAGGMRPVLLDFGAARRVISDATQTLTVILKPGYAPIEQYAESAHSRQGPWTDIYALCATLYYTVTGRVPDPSVSRVVHDDLKPAHTLDIHTMSPAFLALIDHGMAVRPEQRPQSVQALRALLLAATTDADAATSAPIASTPVRGHFDPEATVIIGADSAAGSAVATGDALIAAAATHRPAPPAPAASRAPPNDTTLQAPPRTTKRWLPAAGAAAIAAGALVTWQLLREPADTADKKPPAITAASPEAPSPASPSPQAQGDSTPTTTSPTPELGSPIATETRVARAEPFTVLAALQDIAAGADAQLNVSAQADKPRLIIGTDKLSFKVQSSEPGHIYVYASGTQGNEFVLLFPNAADRNNRIQANKPVRLPREPLHASGPPGTNHLLDRRLPKPPRLQSHRPHHQRQRHPRMELPGRHPPLGHTRHASPGRA